MLTKIICKIFGHKYRVSKVFSPYERKVTCDRCNQAWGMNDSIRMFIPWDGELESMHSFLDSLDHPLSMDREARGVEGTRTV